MARFSVSFSRHTNYFDILHHQLPVAVVSALLPVFNIKRISLTCFRVTRYSGETIYPPPFSATSGGPIATLTSGFDLQHRASYWRSIVTTALKKALRSSNLAEDFWIFLATTCQTMVDCVLFRRSLRLELTSWAYPATNAKTELESYCTDL